MTLHKFGVANTFLSGKGGSELNALPAIIIDLEHVNTRRGDNSYKSSSCLTPLGTTIILFE
jgi:hypothetical protein